MKLLQERKREKFVSCGEACEDSYIAGGLESKEELLVLSLPAIYVSHAFFSRFPSSEEGKFFARGDASKEVFT